MSIDVILRHGELHVPRYACDVCGRIITDAGMANLLWDGDAVQSGAAVTALVAHKRPCTGWR
jgi:hypothetical protein